jgi:hypothetical protein
LPAELEAFRSGAKFRQTFLVSLSARCPAPARRSNELSFDEDDAIRIMPSSPFCTIAIPTYNRAEWLGGCIESLLRQSFPDFEIIVADNASSDDTSAVVRQLTDPRIQYIRHDQNLGAYENFMFCARAGRGEFLIVHQDDDLLHPDFLKRSHQAAAMHPDVTVYGSATLSGDTVVGYSSRVLPDLITGHFDWPLRGEPMLLDGRRMAVRYLFSACVNHPAVALRRSALAAAGGYGPGAEYYCDLVTVPRVMTQGLVAYDPRIGGLSRRHPAQCSTQTSKPQRAQWTHNTFHRQIASLRELVPDWPQMLRSELAPLPAKSLMPMLKDLVGFRAPSEWTSIVWERCRQAEPNRARLLKLLLTRIGVKNTMRLLATR